MKGLPCKTLVDYDDQLFFVQAGSPEKHPMKWRKWTKMDNYINGDWLFKYWLFKQLLVTW